MRYQGNKKLFKLWISPIYQSTRGYDEGYEDEKPWGYEGEIEGLNLDLSSFDSPVQFHGETEKKVIENAISVLKNAGFSGKLKLMSKLINKGDSKWN